MRGATSGKLGIVSKENSNTFYVGSIGNLGHINDELIYLPFIKYIEQQLYDILKTEAKGTATPMVSIGMLEKFKLIIPKTKEQQKYLLDSKSPKSTTSSIFIPPENYDIIFNVSSPIYSIAYSGIIIEKTTQGWKISGYDTKDPFFTYFTPISSQNDPLISIGGVSENFLTWTANKFYGNGVIVKYGQTYFRSLRSHFHKVYTYIHTFFKATFKLIFFKT
jgi:hypothetical protein